MAQRFASPVKVAQGRSNYVRPISDITGYISERHLENGSLSVPNIEKDTVTILIANDYIDEHGVLQKATFDENGVPTTSVILKCKPQKTYAKGDMRLIAGLFKPRGSGAAMTLPKNIQVAVYDDDGQVKKNEDGTVATTTVKAYSLASFHGVRRDSDGNLVCEGCHGLAAADDLYPTITDDNEVFPAKKYFIRDAMVKVLPISLKTIRPQLPQTTLALSQYDAELVGGTDKDSKLENLRNLFDFVAARAASLNVGPAYAIVAYNNDPNSEPQDLSGAVDKHFFQRLDKAANYDYVTGTEMYDDFLQFIEENHSLPDEQKDFSAEVVYNAIYGDKDYSINVLPGYSFTKLHKLPDAVINESDDEVKKKLAREWADLKISSSYIYDAEFDDKGKRIGNGFVLTQKVVREVNGKTFEYDQKMLGWAPSVASLSWTVTQPQVKVEDKIVKGQPQIVYMGSIVQSTSGGVARFPHNLIASGPNGRTPDNVKVVAEQEVGNSSAGRADYFGQLRKARSANPAQASTNESGLVMTAAKPEASDDAKASVVDDEIPF